MSAHRIAWLPLHVGQHRLRCPICGRDRKRDATLGITVKPDGTGVAHCFRCEFVETYCPDAPAGVRRAGRAPAQVHLPQLQQPTRKHQTLSPTAGALWRCTHPLGGAGAHYLRTRKCVLPPAESHLRWLPRFRHWRCGHVGPCLVALLTDARTREPRSLHFTFIDGGQKAQLDQPRLLLPRHEKGGTVCRLWPDEYVTTGLGIAEGIETALSLAHAYAPVWACIDAGNLGAFPVLAGLEHLVIACDRDRAGERAADQCATRYAAASVEVRVTRQNYNDLNDLIQGEPNDE